MIVEIIFSVAFAIVMGYTFGNIARNALRLPFWPFAILGGINVIICSIVLLIVFLVQKSKGTFNPTEEWKNRPKSAARKNRSESAAQASQAPASQAAQTPVISTNDPKPQSNGQSAFCPNCGAPIGSNDKFCGKCGFEL